MFNILTHINFERPFESKFIYNQDLSIFSINSSEVDTSSIENNKNLENYFSDNSNKIDDDNSFIESDNRLMSFFNQEKIKDNIIEVKKDRNNENKKSIFTTKRKRGKPKLNYNSVKTHSPNDNDNIKIKIQVHYLNFIVNFFNDVINALSKIKNYFLYFGYSVKNKVNNKYFENLKQLNLREIFENLTISQKYKNTTTVDDCKTNKKKILLLNKNVIINKLLNMNFLEFFIIYFNDNKYLKEFSIDNINIILSPKTKSYKYLTEKWKSDEVYFKRIVYSDYLNKYEVNCDSNSIKIFEN